MVTMIGDRAGRLSLSTTSMRSLLDTIQARIEESHEISRYVVGLLIFLGLLGTFWGLLATVNSVGETIGGLPAGTRSEERRVGKGCVSTVRYRWLAEP